MTAAVCRACARNTDRTWEGIPGRPGVALCLDCRDTWERSGERARAKELVSVAEQSLTGGERQKEVVTGGIISRAFVDFLARMQKERMVRGQAVPS